MFEKTNMKFIVLFITILFLFSINSCKKTEGFIYSKCENDSSNNYIDSAGVPKMFVPNAFTPNGDHLNDCFHPVCVCMRTNPYSFTVKSGSKTIFSTNNIYESWNGTNTKGDCAGAGQYTYKITTKGTDNKDYVVDGYVTLLLRDSKGNCIGTSDWWKLTFGDMIDPHTGFLGTPGVQNISAEIRCK